MLGWATKRRTRRERKPADLSAAAVIRSTVGLVGAIADAANSSSPIYATANKGRGKVASTGITTTKEEAKQLLLLLLQRYGNRVRGFGSKSRKMV